MQPNNQRYSEPEHFLISPESEPFLERLLFGRRHVVMALLVLMTLVFMFGLTRIRLDSSIEKYIPLQHPFVQSYLKHKDDLKGGVASVRIAVAARNGSIFEASYLQTLNKITDDVFFIAGVDRSALQSLWTPNTRWTEVTEEGFQGGPVIPPDYDGSAASVETVRENVLKSGQVGRLVANDFGSSIIDVPLLAVNAETGEKLDYQQLSHLLEAQVRDRYQNEQIAIYITGVPKKLGDLMDGAVAIGYFFLAAMLMTTALLYWYSRCWRGTLVPVLASLIAVVWQLGALALLGFSIDLYSVLVPFLVFAIGISHAVQVINSIALHAGVGENSLWAARKAFRGLYVPGMLALLSDAMGFLTLLFIDIGVIQELAISASVGVAMIIITNLVLLPVVMSWVGISPRGVEHARRGAATIPALWRVLSGFADRRLALPVLIASLVLAVVGYQYSKGLKIGDLDPGAPELRADSRYNLDNDYMVEHFSTSSDILVVMVETPIEMCNSFKVMDVMDRFMWHMKNVPGVQSGVSLVSVSKLVTKAMNEGNIKWFALSRNQTILNTSVQRAPGSLLNGNCSMAPVVLYLNDHKAETLERVVAEVQQFKARFDDQVDDVFFGMRPDDIQSAIASGKLESVPVRFQLAAGNAGIEAATNEVIGDAQNRMLIFVYLVVFALCLLTFRSLPAVSCILIPLALTSILSQALMTWLGIGVKVATLPVIALGVGIGVDYGIYIYNRLEAMLIDGKNLREAYLETLCSTGKAVSFTGVTLAIGVATWIFSPIRFQADMGILLTFMFIWNMLGALILLPALTSILLRPEHIRQRHQRIHGEIPPAI